MAPLIVYCRSAGVGSQSQKTSFSSCQSL